MLDLKLHPDVRFMHEALTNCKATIELAAASDDYAPAVEEVSHPATAEDVTNGLATAEGETVVDTPATPQVGDAAVELKGVFRIMNTGNAADCVITARGELDGEEPLQVAEPAAIKATLTANFKRKVTFTGGQADTGIVLPDGTTTDFTDKVKVAGADPDELVAIDHGEGAPKSLGIKVATLGTEKPADAEAEFVGMTVATGEGRDPNCNGPFMINQVGEVHLDAVCGWARYRGLKPNPTHLRIRGVNSHAKIYTLGVKDNTHTAHTCGE